MQSGGDAFKMDFGANVEINELANWMWYHRKGSYRNYVGNTFNYTDFKIALVNLIMNQLENKNDKVRFELTGFLYNGDFRSQDRHAEPIAIRAI